MPTSPGPLLTALDALWERLRAEVPDLPPIRPTVSPTNRRGDHSPRWIEDDEGYILGLVVSADVLQEGAETVLEAVLHDAAHLLNWKRGVKDTTMRGAYHNQAFVTAAEEVGLLWPVDGQRTPSRGFEGVELGDEAKRRHALDVRALDRAIPLVLPHLELPAAPRGSRTDRLTLRCECDPPRSFRISRTIAATGPITCGVCGAEFTTE